MTTGAKAPSLFEMQLETTIDQWVAQVPPHLQASFRRDFKRFGLLHESTLRTIEGIWARRERAYAFDESTGLATRRPFHDHLTALLTEQQSPGAAAVGVLFIDVNELKRINDTCGHQVGDRAIAAIGAILRDALRVEGGVDVVARAADDTRAVGRHGGDEFVAALRLTVASEIERVAPRLKRRADDPELQKAHGYAGPLGLKVSIGGVAYESPDTPPDVAPNLIATALLAAADTLMYRSKRDGDVHVARARFTDSLEILGDQRIQPTSV